MGVSEMNTLFIDEGFGSLGLRARWLRLMDVLGALHSGGRVVGIVSHVSELKRAIPAAVEVRPLLGGGSTCAHGFRCAPSPLASLAWPQAFTRV